MTIDKIRAGIVPQPECPDSDAVADAIRGRKVSFAPTRSSPDLEQARAIALALGGLCGATMEALATELAIARRELAMPLFMKHVGEQDANGCWPWLGPKARGYGQFYFAGRIIQAHRASFALFFNPDFDSETLDHLCRNPGCVNPKHLDPCSRRENRLRITRGMAACKNGHPYTEKNTRIARDGRRCCRTCARRYWHISQARRKAGMGAT